MVNRITFLLIFIFLSSCLLTANAQEKADSLIINIGKSKLIFLVNDPKDLDELEKYDLNAILKELKLKLAADSSLLSSESNKNLSQDTTIVIDNTTKEEWDSKWSEEEDRRVGADDKWKDDDRWSDEKQDDSWREDNNWSNNNSSSSSSTRRYRSTRHLVNFDIGINNWLSNGKFPSESNEQYTVRPWGSWYFAVNSVQQTQLKGRLYIEWGPGISWYNFKFEDDRTIIRNDNGITTFTSDPDLERSYKKSKLTVTNVNFMAVPMIQFGKSKRKRYSSVNSWRSLPNVRIGGSDGGFRIGLGGYAGFRLGSRSKVKFSGGKKDKDRGSFNIQTLRYGTRLQMGYKGTDIFINYDLNELFNEGRGPELNAFSFGIIL